MDERRSHERVEGPEDTGAAMVMGNTVREWTTSYDLNYKRRESQVAVNSMESWHAGILAKNAKKQRVLSVPAPTSPSKAASSSVIDLSSDEE